MRLHGGKQAAFDFLRRLKIAKIAVSLGGIESLACHPASTTHSEMTPSQRAECGVTEDLLRISVGVEDWRDLLEDFQRSLSEV
jgi:cystathionine beta-lyase/cystathionine gamma-synthase